MKPTNFYLLLMILTVMTIFLLLQGTTLFRSPVKVMQIYGLSEHNQVRENAKITNTAHGQERVLADVLPGVPMKSLPNTNVEKPLHKEAGDHNRTENANIEMSREVIHIAFLKIHKAASSTVQAIVQRFGLRRNLSIVIADASHYISKQKSFFSDIWPPLPREPNAGRISPDSSVDEKSDILCNHMVFNIKKVRKLLHNDSKYIAIVREPFDQFLSAAYYYKFVWKYPYLDRLSNGTFITDLIRNPQKTEATTMAESMTYNSMAYDFGLEFGSLKEADEMSEEKFNKFLKETGEIFHLVMVVENFDESLVLLKRYLNWSLEDIIYLKTNRYMSDLETDPTKGLNITESDKKAFRKRNKFDYALYEFFKARLEKQIAAEEDAFNEEVEHFKTILRSVQQFCKGNKSIEVEAIQNNSSRFPDIQNKSSTDMKQEENRTVGPECQNKDLLNVINSIIEKKKLTNDQETEILSLCKIPSELINIWTVEKLLRVLPLLFYNKDRSGNLKSKLNISKSKWNKEFLVTVCDCEIFNMDEFARYDIVKENHLKHIVRRKYGDNFSVEAALKFVFTFY